MADTTATQGTSLTQEEVILEFLVLQMKHARVMAEMMRVRGRLLKETRPATRTEWTRNFLRRRPLHGQYETLMHELKWENPGDFRNFMRFDPQMFDELLHRLSPRIKKNHTNFRLALEPGVRLSLTLRYLASGESYKSVMYGFRVASNTVSIIIREVCQAITDEFMAEVVQTPMTQEQWLSVAETFETKWQFPHTIGALDGKHVAIECPPGGGSVFYNYKKFHSIVMMALADADYKLLWVDGGEPGGASDRQIWNACELKQCVEEGLMDIPPAAPLPKDDKPMRYWFIGDDAFGMKTWLLKPFAKRGLTGEERIFNYRLSRARRVVENAFGILVQRFRCLRTTLPQHPDTATKIVKACVCLHNLMRIRYSTHQNFLLDDEDEDHNLVPGTWRNDVHMEELQGIGGNVNTREAKEVRLYMKKYFNGPVGKVPWQDQMVE